MAEQAYIALDQWGRTIWLVTAPAEREAREHMHRELTSAGRTVAWDRWQAAGFPLQLVQPEPPPTVASLTEMLRAMESRAATALPGEVILRLREICELLRAGQGAASGTSLTTAERELLQAGIHLAEKWAMGARPNTMEDQ